MNCLSHALTSVLRNKKNILLFLLMLMLGGLLAVTYLTNYKTERMINNLTTSMRPQGMIGLDRLEILEAMVDPMVSPDLLFIRHLDREFTYLLEKLPYVISYDYIFKRYIFSEDIDMYTAEYNGKYIGAIRRYGTGYKFELRGISTPNFIEIDQGTIEIISGRTFTEEEFIYAYPVAIISEGLAYKNGLTIGSIMPFRSILFHPMKVFCVGCVQEELALACVNHNIEVVGIFRTSSNITGSEKDDIWSNVSLLDHISNRIYVSSAFIEQINKEMKSLAEQHDFFNLLSQLQGESPIGGPPVGHYKFASDIYSMQMQTIFRLDSFYDIDAFVHEIKPILPEFHHIEFAENNYYMIIRSFESYINMSNVLFFFTVGSSILILTLTSILFIRNRKKEIGIYCSLGIKRKNITIRLLLEMTIITLPALLITFLLGNIASKHLLERMIINNLIAAEATSCRLDIGFSLFFWLGLGTEQINHTTLLASIDRTFSTGSLWMLLCLGLGIIVLTTIVSLLYILRLNPKKIMM